MKMTISYNDHIVRRAREPQYHRPQARKGRQIEQIGASESGIKTPWQAYLN